MELLDSVAKDAKCEFFKVFAHVISSIGKHAENQSPKSARSPVRQDDSNDFSYEAVSDDADELLLSDFEAYSKLICKGIAGNKITLICSNDVYDLVHSLFDKKVLELGFLNIYRMKALMGKQNKGFTDDYLLSNTNEVYMIRPTFKDSHDLSSILQTRHNDINRVICLPEVSEMYPEMLNRMLGSNFTVVRYEQNTQRMNNLVELYQSAIHMIPIDGILSMVMSNGFLEFYLEGDPTTAWFFAKAVEYLQNKHLGGAIPQVIGLGTLSKYVTELLVKTRREAASDLIVGNTDSLYGECSFIPFKFPEELQSRPLVNKGTFEDNRILLGNSSTIKSSIIIDRKVDLITPMCTNFTYEGFLDSVFGINDNTVNVDVGILDGKLVSQLDLVNEFYKPKDKYANINKKAIPLNTQLYSDIRWLGFIKAADYLKDRALKINKGYDSSNLQTIGEMGEFVKKFKSLQQENIVLYTHYNIMEYLKSFVRSDRFQLIQNLEDGILHGSVDHKQGDSKLNISKLWAKKTDDPFISLLIDLIFWNTEISHVYRLLILLSQTNDGIKQDDFNIIKKAIISQYGFEHLYKIQKFLKCGLIKVVNTVNTLRWPKLFDKFNLLVSPEYASSDYSNVFGGYAPLSVRIAQLLNITNDLKPLQSEFALLNSPIVSIQQMNLLPEIQQTKDSEAAPSACLVSFIGGITMGEIVALSLLNSSNKSHYTVLTTHIINSNHLIDL
ncbi:hypothetical protein BEWA_006770 [Theileria equi strain WA]|uniref:Uncharacterized protein n=1 Tax=Theileria equi strain WA TaxID=1537102 RepID=L0B183_THEEQ|nr:hypothetical protein BEWA_006770 [Theileria equi strain WA]AFZ81268.1 hypothetical protein BEWA_006770 [Theileria equi strain WA]|eukprot:XP_004830934.1 hypothetical protein BEWA_006770 [Theileria equi strain WA]